VPGLIPAMAIKRKPMSMFIGFPTVKLAASYGMCSNTKYNGQQNPWEVSYCELQYHTA
jgi:hypothetical protein